MGDRVVCKSAIDDWSQYYDAGARRRFANGGDYIRRYQERELAKDRLALAGSGLVLIAMVTVFCVLLMS